MRTWKKRDSFPHHWFFDYTLRALETICCWLISCSVVSAAQRSAAKEHIHPYDDENTIDSWWWWCWRVIYIFHQFCNRKRKNNSLFDVYHNCILHEQLIQKFKHQGASWIKEIAAAHFIAQIQFAIVQFFCAHCVHLLAILAILIRLKMSALYICSHVSLPQKTSSPIVYSVELCYNKREIKTGIFPT